MKKIVLLIAVAAVCVLSSCSPTAFQEVRSIQPGLSLVAPNGVRLANSTEEIITNAKSTFESKYGSGVTCTVTKITYGGVAPFEERAIQAGAAVARVDFKTSKGQIGDFIYVNTPKSNSN